MTVKEKKSRGKTPAEENVGVKAAIRSEAIEVTVQPAPAINPEPTPVSEIEIIDVDSAHLDEAWDRQQKINELIQQKIDEKAPRYNEVNDLLDRAEQHLESENATIGKLLYEMQQSSLYRVEFDTFEQYMESRRPNLWRGTAYRWLDHAAVVTRLTHEAQKQQIELPLIPSQSAAQHLKRVKDDNELFVNWLGMCATRQTTADAVKRFVVKKHGPTARDVLKKTTYRVIWSSLDDDDDGKKVLGNYAAGEVTTTEKAGKKRNSTKVESKRLPALLHDLATFVEQHDGSRFHLSVS
jgi:hypothetical protein